MMIALALALSLATATADESAWPVGVSCDGTTLEMVRCAQGQVDAWEHRRAAEYKAALQRAPVEARPQVERAERLWLQFREANCAINSFVDGTIRPLLVVGCRLDMTKARAKELHDFEW